MKPLAFAGGILLVLILQLPLIKNEHSLPEKIPYQGSFSEAYAALSEAYGPFDEEMILEDGGWMRNKSGSFDVLRDNYMGTDYLIFINNN